MAEFSNKWLMFKIDAWILPCVTVTFLLSFLDKTNIANANVFGLAKDLRLQGREYNICLVVLFVAYACFNIPCTIAMKKVKPSVWLPLCTFLFGLISMCQGFVQSYGSLLTARFFLGITEACSFSGCFYLLSHWYRRDEAQKRFTFFYASSQLAGAFSGLLASAIGLLDGSRGLEAWRWIFIIEGVVTAAIAVGLFFVMPSFPQQTKWLSSADLQTVLDRLAEDDNDKLEDGRITIRRLFSTIRTSKIFLSGFFYFVLLIPAYAYAFFVPTIIKGFTAGAIRTQLLSVPPWACAWVASLAVAWLSDHFRHRLSFVVLPLLLAIPGYSVLLSTTHQPHTQYGAVFLVALGVWVPLPVVVCWCTLNVQGHASRGIALGWFFMVSQISGIPAVYLFSQDEAPAFTTGYSTCVACITVGIIFAFAYGWVCRRENEAAVHFPGVDQDTKHDAVVTEHRVLNLI